MVDLVVISGLLFFGVSDAPVKETDKPTKTYGVWTVISASNNGKEMPMPENPGESLAAGECNFSEFIVCESRIVIVLSGGDSIVAKTRVLGSQPQVRIEMLASRYHDKEQEPKYAILKLVDKNKIQIAFCPKDAKTVNSQKGGNQIVLTATR